jgi:hypothetical protein
MHDTWKDFLICSMSRGASVEDVEDLTSDSWAWAPDGDLRLYLYGMNFSTFSYCVGVIYA